MTGAHSSTVVPLLVASLASRLCFAQSDRWERVQLIEPGRKVSVTLTTGKSVNGRMRSWTEEEVAVIQSKDTLIRVPKGDVAKVAMVAGMSRGARAGYSALIGGGAGAAIFGGWCAGDRDCDVSPSLVGGAAAVWIGGIAAAVAALIPQHKEVIYRDGPQK